MSRVYVSPPQRYLDTGFLPVDASCMAYSEPRKRGGRLVLHVIWDKAQELGYFPEHVSNVGSGSRDHRFDSPTHKSGDAWVSVSESPEVSGGRGSNSSLGNEEFVMGHLEFGGDLGLSICYSDSDPERLDIFNSILKRNIKNSEWVEIKDNEDVIYYESNPHNGSENKKEDLSKSLEVFKVKMFDKSTGKSEGAGAEKETDEKVDSVVSKVATITEGKDDRSKLQIELDEDDSDFRALTGKLGNLELDSTPKNEEETIESLKEVWNDMIPFNFQSFLTCDISRLITMKGVNLGRGKFNPENSDRLGHIYSRELNSAFGVPVIQMIDGEEGSGELLEFCSADGRSPTSSELDMVEYWNEYVFYSVLGTVPNLEGKGKSYGILYYNVRFCGSMAEKKERTGRSSGKYNIIYPFQKARSDWKRTSGSIQERSDRFEMSIEGAMNPELGEAEYSEWMNYGETRKKYIASIPLHYYLPVCMNPNLDNPAIPLSTFSGVKYTGEVSILEGEVDSYLYSIMGGQAELPTMVIHLGGSGINNRYSGLIYDAISLSSEISIVLDDNAKIEKAARSLTGRGKNGDAYEGMDIEKDKKFPPELITLDSESIDYWGSFDKGGLLDKEKQHLEKAKILDYEDYLTYLSVSSFLQFKKLQKEEGSEFEGMTPKYAIITERLITAYKSGYECGGDRPAKRVYSLWSFSKRRAEMLDHSIMSTPEIDSRFSDGNAGYMDNLSRFIASTNSGENSLDLENCIDVEDRKNYKYLKIAISGKGAKFADPHSQLYIDYENPKSIHFNPEYERPNLYPKMTPTEAELRWYACLASSILIARHNKDKERLEELESVHTRMDIFIAMSFIHTTFVGSADQKIAVYNPEMGISSELDADNIDQGKQIFMEMPVEERSRHIREMLFG